MLTQEVIRLKRNGGTLNKAQIEHLISGMQDTSVTEGQIAAFAMAVFFQGMNTEECLNLTKALQHSGTTLDWSEMNLDGPVVDKHSTGGIGDKVSLILAPALAACGVYVPMISGRGLGHSGGTLDKMDAIAGYQTSPDIDSFKKVVKAVGCAIVGQTADLAPADKTLYGIRDVTATVECTPLITASILSKKLAAGLDCLVMDVKVGSGAFNETLEVARALAETLVQVSNGFGLKTSALITDMSAVLGHTVGNALEVQEAVDFLDNSYQDARLLEVVVQLGAELLVLAGKHEHLNAAQKQIINVLDSGAAEARFNLMVNALGGPKNFTSQARDCIAAAACKTDFIYDSEQPGYIQTIDGRAVGNALVSLGGGRKRPQDTIDHSVGFAQFRSLGDLLQPGDRICEIHAQSMQAAEQAKHVLLQAIGFSHTKPPPTPLIHDIINYK